MVLGVPIVIKVTGLGMGCRSWLESPDGARDAGPSWSHQMGQGMPVLVGVSRWGKGCRLWLESIDGAWDAGPGGCLHFG